MSEVKEFAVRVLRSFIKNIKPIISALIVSIIIWFAVSLQIFPSVSGHVDDIKVKSERTELMRQENLQIVGEYSQTVSVRIEGKRYDIGKLEAKDFDARLDLSEVTKSGRQEVKILVTPIDSTKCSVKDSDHLTSYIDVIKVAEKTLDLTVNTNALDITEGMSVDAENVKIYPEKVTITGEDRLIASITRAEVKPVLNGVLAASTELKGGLSLFNNENVIVDNPDITESNSYFTVSVPIFKRKTLPVDFAIINCPSNFDIDGLREKMMILPKELTIASPDNSIDNLTRINIGDMSLSELTYVLLATSIRQPVVLTDGYRNISGTEKCDITFTGVNDYSVYTFTLSSGNFHILNAPANFDVEILTKELTVQIIGPSSFVQAMSVGDISVFVNFMGVEVTEGAKKINVSYKINGTNVPAWLVGNPKMPQIDVLLKSR